MQPSMLQKELTYGLIFYFSSFLEPWEEIIRHLIDEAIDVGTKKGVAEDHVNAEDPRTEAIVKKGQDPDPDPDQEIAEVGPDHQVLLSSSNRRDQASVK